MKPHIPIVYNRTWYEIFLYPDIYLKHGTSEGGSYSYEVDKSLVDGKVVWLGNLCHAFTLVEYLRVYMYFGGILNEEILGQLNLLVNWVRYEQAPTLENIAPVMPMPVWAQLTRDLVLF